MSRTPSSLLIVGVDTGGTFTDIVFRQGSESGRFKLLSTPDDPARAVLDGLARLFDDRAADLVTYGSTVATNAVIERRGAKTVLLTTTGFEDVLEIGRQARPLLYALEPAKPAPLVERRLRRGVRERTLYDGAVKERLTRDEMARIVEEVRTLGAESVALCLLHSTANPAHEKRLAKALARLGVPVTLSHELSAEPGEYERSSTAVANAYVRPKLASHIAGLATASNAAIFRVMQSNGGAIGTDTACREPVRTMLSGPAGGVAAGWRLARAASLEHVITLDMGGTSTDVALLDGGIPRRSSTEVAGIPVRTACVDIHAVGAGGGSIAYLDEGGSLKVGPHSAGADPGPACYGRGTEPTVTDANLVLGRLRADRFLGGHMKLDEKRAVAALQRLAADIGARSPAEAAEGVVRVVEGNMERAIRVITVERGHDPRACTLVAFGGAAPLHACGLARELAIPRILVPPIPGLFSATGVLDGPVVRDEAQALRTVDPSLTELSKEARPLAARARAHVIAEGVAAGRIVVDVFARARYLGQSITIEVPLDRAFRSRFHEAHERLYRYSDPGRSIEVAGLRATATGHGFAPWPPMRKARRRSRQKAAAVETATVFLGRRHARVPIYRREDLEVGTEITGPAIVVEYSSTALVARGWRLRVDAEMNLVLEAPPSGRATRSR